MATSIQHDPSHHAVSDEELARRLQQEEQKEYEEFQAARRVQCDDDHEFAKYVSEYGFNSEVNTPNATVVNMCESDSDYSDHPAERPSCGHSREMQTRRTRSSRTNIRHTTASGCNRNNRQRTVPMNDSDTTSDSEFDIFGESTASSSSGRNSNSGRTRTRSSKKSSTADACDDSSEYMESDAIPMSSQSSSSMIFNSAVNAVGSAFAWVSNLLSPTVSATRMNREHLDEEETEEEETDEEEAEEIEEDEEVIVSFGDDDEEDWLGDESDEENEDDDDDVIAEYMLNHPDYVMNRGLKKNEIEMLPTRTYSSVAQSSEAVNSNCQNCNECLVCISPFSDGDNIRTLPCCHQFHSKCIDVWLGKNALCPVCRVDILREIGQI